MVPAKRSPPRCEHSQVCSGTRGGERRRDPASAHRAARSCRPWAQTAKTGSVRRHAGDPSSGTSSSSAASADLAPHDALAAGARVDERPARASAAASAGRGGGWRAARMPAPSMRCTSARPSARSNGGSSSACRTPAVAGSRRGTSGRRVAPCRRAGRRGRGRRRCRAPTARPSSVTPTSPRSPRAAGGATTTSALARSSPGRRPDGDRLARAQRAQRRARPRAGSAARVPRARQIRTRSPAVSTRAPREPRQRTRVCSVRSR